MNTQLSFLNEKKKKSGETLTVLSMGWGQDSVAILIMYIMDFMNFRKRYAPGKFVVVFCNTGNEKKETYEYIKYFSPVLESEGIEHYILTSKKGLKKLDKSLHKFCVYGHQQRTWQTLQDQYLRNRIVMSLLGGKKSCTDNLKIKPFYSFLNDYLMKNYGYNSDKRTNYKAFAQEFGKVNAIIGFSKGEERRVEKDGLKEIREKFDSFLDGNMNSLSTEEFVTVKDFYDNHTDKCLYRLTYLEKGKKISKKVHIESISGERVRFINADLKFKYNNKKVPIYSVRKYSKYAELKNDALEIINLEQIIKCKRVIDYIELGVEKIYPLIDYGFDRGDCQNFISTNGFNIPMPSACEYCPFQCEATFLFQYKTNPGIIKRMKIYERRKIEKSRIKNKGLNKGNHGIFKMPIEEFLNYCQKKLGHLSVSELRNEAFNHGHKISNRM